MLDSKKIEEDWELTDDDSFQICRKIEDGLYELYQVTQITPSWKYEERGFRVSHAWIYTAEADLDDICLCFGYDSVEQLKEEYGDCWEQIVAECDFELCATECMIKTGDLTYQEAAALISKLSGYKMPSNDPLVSFMAANMVCRKNEYDFRYIPDTGKVLVQKGGSAALVQDVEEYKKLFPDGLEIWKEGANVSITPD